VQAISLRLSWTTTNDSLDKLHPNPKEALYYKVPNNDLQDSIEGVPETTPNLRVPTMATPLAVDADFSGYTLTIDHGIDESTALQLYQCAMDKFKIDPKEGGSVTISWSLSSNKQVTPELVGALCGLEGEEVTAHLVAPEVAEGDVIDGTVDAFNKDHPDAGPLFDDDAPAMDATQAFIRSGADEGLDAYDMPPGTHDEGERAEQREEAVSASKARSASTVCTRTSNRFEPPPCRS